MQGDNKQSVAREQPGGPTPRRIAHYRVVRPLGTGGMGEVLLAEDTRLERLVALKVMSVELAGDENQRKRFRTEAKAVSGLTHPNICVVYEVGETEDRRPFLAMEYIEGATLETIGQERRLKLREVIAIGEQVAEALATAHQRGIVHRDIKPGNIMLDRRGQVKVLDFGLAKRWAGEELSAATTSVAQTRVGMLIGTPHYMSPEQALGRELGPRTDIFSLGAVLYELTRGQKPFVGHTVGEVINNVVNQQPEPLGLENPIFSPALDQILFRCLEKDPGRRYPSASALAQDLAKLREEAERAGKPAQPLASLRERDAAAGPAPTQIPPGSAEPRRGLHRFGLGPAVVVAAALVGGALLYSHWGRRAGFHAAGGTQRQPSSVAVLPFDNFSGEPDTDYLSDGLTEEITTALARVHGLRVAARNSAFTFRGRNEDVRKIGAALRVSAVLEGSIRKVGKQLRVAVQLINTADGFQLWSETYERSVDDVLAVQEDIARRIVERLQGQSADVQVRARTIDPEAHRLYLQALQFWNKRTEAGLKRAAQLFQESIDRDASYAAAHAGLAAAYLLLPGYSLSARATEYRPLARAAANRALEFDPDCAEAHAVLAQLLAKSDHKAAEEHFQRALQLAPNYATAHHWYGNYLEGDGRREEAFREFQTALDLDPLSPVIHSTIPLWYFLGGDFDRALEEGRKVEEKFPDFPLIYELVAEPLIAKGSWDEALKELDKGRALQPDQPMAFQDMRAIALARSGRDTEARKILAEFKQLQAQGQPVASSLAWIYVGLKEYDNAIAALEIVEADEGLDPEILCEPLMKELRGIPRFEALLVKAGLKPEPT